MDRANLYIEPATIQKQFVMSKFIYLILFTLPIALLGQNTSGYVTFDEKINLHKRIKTDNPEIKAMLPEFKTDKKVLYFSPDACLYKNVSKEDGDLSIKKSEGDHEVKMVFRAPENILFRDLKEGKTIEKKEFMTRDFLINGELPKKTWKITGKQENIAGFLCMEAVLDDTVKTVAWFTPQIPVSAGPAIYGDLPGLILKVSQKDDEVVFEATKVEFQEIDAEKFAAPTEGKKVSREKFEKIVEEKMKEMQETQGGNSTIRIIKN